MTLPPDTTPLPPTSSADDSDPAIAQDARVHTWFQPFYNLATDRLQGFEALARVSRGDGVPGSPAAYFAELEKSGGSRDVDLWILAAALDQLDALQREDHLRDLIVSVNVTSGLLTDGTGAQDILTALRDHSVPGDRLLLDITTDIFRRISESDPAAMMRVARLQEAGISFCLDGFTTADLDLLPAAQDVRVDIIKLHPREIGAPDTLTDLVDAVGEAGLPLVAAGIETPEQLTLVRELGVEWAQGFLLGAPAPAEDVLATPLALTR